ncbi:MAG: cytochrome c-type biogenesis protein [Arenicellales bacterium]
MSPAHTIVSLATVALFGLSLPSLAAIESLEFETAGEESRYQKMIGQLRCLVCQNQNLADSNADLAKDLRAKTYQMIRSGASDTEIVDFMVTRYGDFVLYRPPLRGRTILLWGAPLIFLLIALTVFFYTLRRRRIVAEPLNREQQSRAAKLLDPGRHV